MSQGHIGDELRAARVALGISEEMCADHCGLSEAYYYDVEAHGAEFFDNISLGTARRICALLDLDLLGLIARWRRIEIRERAYAGDKAFYSRDSLVADKRRSMGAGTREVADAIGFDEVIVQLLERTPDFIECLPICSIIELAKTLQLDTGLLVGNRTKV